MGWGALCPAPFPAGRSGLFRLKVVMINTIQFTVDSYGGSLTHRMPIPCTLDSDARALPEGEASSLDLTSAVLAAPLDGPAAPYGACPK